VADSQPAFVSILKPVHGADPGFYAAIRSNAVQEYPSFEILFGADRPDDPAIPAIEKLAREFPNRRIRLFREPAATPNAKAGKLARLASAATGSVLVISDADIHVPDGYLRRVVAPLADPGIGLVTCAYRARGESWPARFEALGVATDFGPSTMVAPFVGVDEFALGSTIALRKADLDRIGGFEAVADYLADDYQLGRLIHGLGLRCVLSEVIVETHLPGQSWSEVWRHQVRWARTIRVSRAGGYAGLPVTHATLWALLAALAGLWQVAVGLMAIRYAMAIVAGCFVLRSIDTLRLWWLIPVRDLWGSAVWAAGLFGRSVEWGGEELRLSADGRILR
jgi:ceramide glucosyltransferase